MEQNQWNDTETDLLKSGPCSLEKLCNRKTLDNFLLSRLLKNNQDHVQKGVLQAWCATYQCTVIGRMKMNARLRNAFGIKTTSFFENFRESNVLVSNQ